MTVKMKHIALSDQDLATFRTTLCEANQAGNCKDADRCPYSHCLTWQRRNPYEISYAPKLCPDIQFVKKGSKMSLVRRCNRGRHCQFAHSKEEELYHPMTYKTKLCSIAPTCARFFCPFAHSSEEIRGRIKPRPSKHPDADEKQATRHYVPNDACSDLRHILSDPSNQVDAYPFSPFASYHSNNISPPHMWDSSLRPLDNQSWSEGSTTSTGNLVGTESISSESLSPSPSFQGCAPCVESTLVKVACALLSSSSTTVTADDKDDCVSSRSSVVDTSAETFYSQGECGLSQRGWNYAEGCRANQTQLVTDLVVTIANCLNHGWQMPTSQQWSQYNDGTSDPKMLNDVALSFTKCLSGNSTDGLAFDHSSESWSVNSPYRMDESMTGSHHPVKYSAPSLDNGQLNASKLSTKAPDFFDLTTIPNNFPFMDNSGYFPNNFQDFVPAVAQDADYDRLWTEISNWCDTGRSESQLA